MPRFECMDCSLTPSCIIMLVSPVPWGAVMIDGPSEELSEHGMPLKTAQIGKAGELLVQHLLLLGGIESSQMSTDAGVDLVAYSPRSNQARTIQVKTNLKPKHAGGKGKLELDWWFPAAGRAQLLTLVDISERRIWLFDYGEAVDLAQQKPKTRADVHLYMHLEHVKTRTGHAHTHVDHFGKFRLEERLGLIHGPF